MILKPDMQHRKLKLYKFYINDNPGFSLIYFTARSNYVPYAFDRGKLLERHLMGKLAANDQINRRFMILYDF